MTRVIKADFSQRGKSEFRRERLARQREERRKLASKDDEAKPFPYLDFAIGALRITAGCILIAVAIAAR